METIKYEANSRSVVRVRGRGLTTTLSVCATEELAHDIAELLNQEVLAILNEAYEEGDTEGYDRGFYAGTDYGLYLYASEQETE